LILLACAGVFLIGPLTIVVVLLLTSRSRSHPAAVQPLPAPVTLRTASAASVEDADSRQAVVARLTQRFCPGCRSPLAADSPEGLCPACLLAGGLGGENKPPLVNGMAATTPPSGSQPPASGEWADLAERFPQLEILELLGRGGMGTVYKVRQKNLDRIIALKVIPPDAAKDPAFAERFARESRAMARLNHPNIVTVYDSGQEGELYWLMMEYVDGVNLRHTLRAGHLTPREALAIVPQVCDALQYAHDQGVVHRDIKPENVLLDRTGRVKIADFGLAKLLGKGPDDFTLTRTQQVMGTPRYMAPEQIERPTAVDHRADIYSLGVVLYEMLTGELPLGRFDPPSHKVQVDVRIDQVVLRALEKAPERRYQRASEVKTELASAVSWPPLPAAASETQSPQRNEPAPIWHTPAPASKGQPTPFPSEPGGYSLGQVMIVAGGILLGVLVATGGLFAIVFGLIEGHGNDLWAWLGSGFGCLIGGLGAAAGSYNTYRQMAGAEDLMRSPRVTWFDWVMRAYALVGVALLASGLIALTQFEGNDDPIIALMSLGSIVTFQGGLFLLWRAMAPKGATGGQSVARPAAQPPAEPGYLRAVILPAAALLAVLGVLLADVHFAMPRPGTSGVTPQMEAYRAWYEGLVLAAIIAVPLCLIGLGAWRTWAPRREEPDGRWRVSFPFAHPAWLWAIAALAGLSLFFPWFRLDVVPNSLVVLQRNDVFPHLRGSDGVVSVQATHEELRHLAAVPVGGRYAHPGIRGESTGAATILLLFVAILCSLVFEAMNPARIALLLVAGGIALLLTTLQLHQGADQKERVVIDATVTQGLSEHANRMWGEWPADVGPWQKSIRRAIVARPTLGAFALLAACGLAIFIGTTELCWIERPGPAQPAAAKPAARAPAIDPAREAIRRRVAGPAIGLIGAGLLGFAPVVLALMAVPAVTLVPAAPKHDTGQGDPPWDARSQPVPAPGFVPLVNPGLSVASTTTLLGPHLILAADSEASGALRPVPMWTTMMLAAVTLLVSLPISLTLIIGGWRMRQLKSYGLAMVASILALLPCGIAWLIGLPMGIWALVLLRDPSVREAFDS
jgi:predicted Ser/Thr protein kinase